MSSFDDNDAPPSFWRIMCQYIPKPEISEVKRIIGVTLIDSNESLWNELCSLKSILSQGSTYFPIDFSSVILSNGMRRMVTGTSSNSSYSICVSAQDVLEHLFHDCESKANSIQKAMRIDVDSLQDKQIIAQIRAAYSFEKNALEVEYNRLVACMNDEVEESIVSSRCSSPRSNPPSVSKLGGGRIDECINCHCKLTGSSVTTSIDSSGFDSILDSHEATGGNNICRRCRSEKLLHGRLPKQQKQSQSKNSSTNTSNTSSRASSAHASSSYLEVDDDADSNASVDTPTSHSVPDSPRPAVGEGKALTGKKADGIGAFRSRIRAAMEEHHFFDDIR